MRDMLATPELGKDFILFLPQLGRYDACDGLSDHLVGLIAEDAGRARVP